MHRWRAVTALALGFGIAACSGASRVGFPNVSPFYTPGVVRYAGGGGAMPLIIHGQPFAGLNAQQTAAMTAERMRLPGWFPPIPFRPAPVAGAPSGRYRSVVVFNPAALSTDGDDACGPLDQVKTAPPERELRIVAAFCTNDDMITAVRAAAPVGGPDDPAFRGLLVQVAYALFPPRNPLHDSDRRDFLLERPWN